MQRLKNRHRKAEFYGGGFSFYNFAVGGCAAIQNLYELKRARNEGLFSNAELIITESNINEIHNHIHPKQKLPLRLIYRDLSWFYKELYFLNKKVLVIALAECSRRKERNLDQLINNIHKKFCLKYGFNFINLREYFEQKNLLEFGRLYDGGGHQFNFIMQNLGKNIISSLNEFQVPKKLELRNDNPKFHILSPKDMTLLSGNLEELRLENSMYDEKAFRLSKDTRLKFPKELEGYFVVGIHSWTSDMHLSFDFPLGWGLGAHTSLILENENLSFSKENAFINQFVEVQKNFQIDKKSLVKLNHNELSYSEFHVNVISWHENAKKVEHCDIIAFFLASNTSENFSADELQELAFLKLELPEIYDFARLIPPVELFKEIIDEFCARMDPRKLLPLQNELKAKDKELRALKARFSGNFSKDELERLNLEQNLINKKLKTKKLCKELGISHKESIMPKITIIESNSAKARIHGHLAYKLGAAMIRNSKSFLGYLKLPYILKAITIAHREELENSKFAAVKPAPLEIYSDYKEALKEKECFTYKLGLALMKADKTWFKGGYLNFYFNELPKLKAEFRAKKREKES